ncbi:hypothetical protein ACJIZ3_000850 [Penstemon smallii]|uniref:F-box domain-containing protein n=1 Tax=Penstemon smallii TaxID=265156 RepID=A0ABD3U313_9LAMI
MGFYDMYSGVPTHVALPILAFAGLAGFEIVRTSFSISKTRSISCLVKILHSKVFSLSNNPDVDEMDDIISELPNDILLSIISRLSTIEAVRTSILSRKWRDLYKFIHHVKFDCFDMLKFSLRGNPRFGVEAVDTFFQHYSGPRFGVEAVDTFFQHYSGSKLVSFRLTCHFRSPYLDSFHLWMQSLCRLGVEQLELLRIDKDHEPYFSWNLLYEASSLEKVSLNNFNLKLELMNSCYPFKVLEFHCVDFAPGAIECIVSSCPSLTTLTLTECTLPSKVCIHNPKLTLLRIELDFPTRQDREIDIHAINLNSFEYKDCRRRRLTFSCVPSLERLSITLNGNGIRPSVFGQLMEDLPPVKTLYYENSDIDLQEYKICELNNTLLRNLRELFFILIKPECKLLRITKIFDACPLLQKFHLMLQARKPELIKVMNASPYLQKFHMMSQTLELSSSDDGHSNIAGFHSELEEVELTGFTGTENEMRLALYILKTAVSLKQMRIIRCQKRYVGYGRWEWMENMESRFNEEKRRMIHERLEGQALSKSAQVIILG